MNLKIWKDKGKTQYLITIEDFEFAQISLDQVNRKLLEECEVSVEVSDKILALEMLTRKIEKLHENL